MSRGLPQLADMPVELVERIAGLCDPHSLGSLRRTCKAYRRLQDDAVWQRCREGNSSLMRQFVEQIASIRNAIFAEVHSLPLTGSNALTREEWQYVFDAVKDTYTLSLDDDGYDGYNVLKLRGTDAEVYVFIGIDDLGITRSSLPCEILDSVGVYVGYFWNAQTNYDLKAGNVVFSLDVATADNEIEVREPLTKGTQVVLSEGCSSIVRDIATIFHGYMLHYFASSLQTV